MFNNSIIGATTARDKLQAAFVAHFKNVNARFELGIQPTDGKYHILAFITTQRHLEALPADVDGYRVSPTMVSSTRKLDF